jgi:hypothetical protein
MSRRNKKTLRKLSAEGKVSENLKISNPKEAETAVLSAPQTPRLCSTHPDTLQGLQADVSSPKPDKTSRKKAKTGALEDFSKDIEISDSSESELEFEPQTTHLEKTFSDFTNLAEELLTKLDKGEMSTSVFPNSPTDIQNQILQAELPNSYFPGQDLQRILTELEGKNLNDQSTLLFVFMMKNFSALCHQNSLTFDLLREGIYKSQQQNEDLKHLLGKMLETLNLMQKGVQSLITAKGGFANLAHLSPEMQNLKEKNQNSVIKNMPFSTDPKMQVEVQLAAEPSGNPPTEPSGAPFILEGTRQFYAAQSHDAQDNTAGAGAGAGAGAKKFKNFEKSGYPDLTPPHPLAPVWSGFGRILGSDPRILRSEDAPESEKVGNRSAILGSMAPQKMRTIDPVYPPNLEGPKLSNSLDFDPVGQKTDFSAPQAVNYNQSWASVTKQIRPTSLPSSGKKTLFPFQVSLNFEFDSSGKARFEFFQPYQIKNNLPKFKMVGVCSDQKGGTSCKKFVLYFQFAWERSKWIQHAVKDIENFDAVAMASLRYPKILVEGVPPEVAFSAPNEIVKILSSGFGLRAKAFKYLFQTPVDKSNPEYFSVILAVHPDARRHIFAMGDQCLFEELKFSVQVRDFMIPLQCNKCTAFDHATKHCPYLINCKQCCSPTCSVNPKDTCPNRGCVNCGEKTHTGLQRAKCEIYKNLVQKTFNILSEILKTDCPPDSSVLLTSGSDLNLVSGPETESDSSSVIVLSSNPAKAIKINAKPSSVNDDDTQMQTSMEECDEQNKEEINADLSTPLSQQIGLETPVALPTEVPMSESSKDERKDPSDDAL